jgi:heavy metal translocating P-type ATPase
MLKVEGMWCTACSWLIEEVLKKTRGILSARVLFFSDLVRIRYLPQQIDPETILARISKLGYQPSLCLDPSENSPERKNLVLRLGVSSILAVNIMMISFALYFGFFQELGQEAIRYFSYPLFFLSTVVLFYGGFPILKRAFIPFRYLNLSMDTLIALGALAAYFYSVLQMAKGSLHLYFDTASMLITLVLLGRYIEARTREKVFSGISELYALAKQKVRLSNSDKERWVSSEAMGLGEEFLVLGGERVPLDGRVVSGRGNIDESIFTGELRPICKEKDDDVTGGTLLLEGELRLKATRLGRESSVGQMIELIHESFSKKNPFELLSDRIMRWFIPTIIGIAIGTAFYLWSHGVAIDTAILRAVTVLVITCPCALGIASPLAKVAAVGKCRSEGIFIRDPIALEQAKDLNVLIFDKTGTMTRGNFSLQEVVTRSITEKEALLRIASVELHSDHFLAKEIVRKAKESFPEIEEATGFEALDGLGVKGLVRGSQVVVGNREFMSLQGMYLPTDFEENGRLSEFKGMTTLFFGWEGQVQGFLVFGDSLKEGAKQTIQELQKKGIRTWLVSGDAEETTRVIANELGIDRFLGHALPKDKVEIIRRLQKQGDQVGMVGDGFNDAAALAQANVGFALTTSPNIAKEASDVTLLTEDPFKIIETLNLSALTVKTIRQNLLFAFVYNGIGIPLAVAGLLNPLVAVFAMFVSSLSVIGNTLRISKPFLHAT